jgi:hypothetical protein
MFEAAVHPGSPALVAKADPAHCEAFLKILGAGEAVWTPDPQEATAFASMREAMRMAIRLPAGLRAYGVPATSHPPAERLH